MIDRIRRSLALVRPANLCTAVADVTAGALYMGARVDDWPQWTALAAASALLYAGGVALNDVCDAGRDAVQRPERPIPAGLISRRTGLCVALFLLIGGVMLAGVHSRLSGGIAGGLTASAVLYNVLLKQTLLGPVLMGLCRALNLALGMSIIPTYRTPIGLAPLLLLMWLYVASVTVLAAREHVMTSRIRVWTAGVGLLGTIAGLAGLTVLVPGVRYDYLIGVALLLGFVTTRLTRAARKPDPISMQRIVSDLVLALICFDACIVWAARGFTWMLAVLWWIIPAGVLARTFRVS